MKIFENNRIRVWDRGLDPCGPNGLFTGGCTGWHRHEYDYVVVPLFDGVLEIDLGNGERVTAPMQNGVPYFRELGVEHDVINGNDFECAFVEVEPEYGAQARVRQGGARLATPHPRHPDPAQYLGEFFSTHRLRGGGRIRAVRAW